ncbi:MAG: DUF1566 domain-containing protein, partial [Treponema sp.]|nr:DUF1566 domain-containing protein [Treponema sp.]
ALIISTVIFQLSVFAQSKNSPKIGDKGPGGGTIFYIYGRTAYECADLFWLTDWKQAEDYSKTYNGGGKSGWYLPSIEQLNSIYENLVKTKIMDSDANYWSSTCPEDHPKCAYMISFKNGRKSYAGWISKTLY